MPDGLSPLSEPPSLEGVASEDRIELMVQWFFENFEDPANEMPYDGREGGYQYIHGGPFEASDYITDHFPDATEEEQQEAIDQIDADGPEWAPAGHRVEYPEEPEDFEPFDQLPPPLPLEVRLEALGAQLEEIRGYVLAIREVQQTVPPRPEGGTFGIGHNQPPKEEELDLPDLNEVLETVELVEAELAKPDAVGTANEGVIEAAEGVFSKFLAWVKGIVKDAPTLLAKGALTFAGAKLAEYVWNHRQSILHNAEAVAETVRDWSVHLSVALF